MDRLAPSGRGQIDQVTIAASKTGSRRRWGGVATALLRRLLSDHPGTTMSSAEGLTARITRRLVGLERAHPLAADTLLALFTAALTIPWVLRPEMDAGPGTWSLEAALIIPLIWRRRHPQAVFAVLGAVALIQWWSAVPLSADVSLLIALYTLAAHRTRFVAVAGAIVAEVGVIMATTRWVLAGSEIRSFVFVSGLVAAALLLGANLQSRRANVEALTERAERLEVERDQHARLAAAAERTLIAREMHDVIAHSLAVIVSMADGAAAKLRRDPDRAEAAIHSVSDVGREALRETRRLLGVLRDDTAGDGLAPQPTIAQLPGLIGKLKTAGLNADLKIDGQPFAMPAGAELAIYRIVQEATTNTLKHAVAATAVHVCVRYDRPEVAVRITDDGVGFGVDADDGVDVSSGHGLPGMRERVSLYNGTVVAGSSETGGWVVSARLAAGSAPTAHPEPSR